MQAFIPPTPTLASSFTSTSSRHATSSLRRRPFTTAISRRPSCSLTAPASASGSFTLYCDEKEIAVGDTVMIEYAPAPGSPLLEESAGILLWTGGFNGWQGTTSNNESEEDGSEQTLDFPFTPLLNGRFRVSVIVPDYATSINFCVTTASGWAWDDNNGKMYTIPIKYRKKLGDDGEVIEFEAIDDSQPVHRDAKVEEDAPRVMMPEKEAILHRLRGEAALVGEEKGLGTIHISQARDTFDMFDYERIGTISVNDMGKALEHLSFDMKEEEVKGLIDRFVKDEERVTMVEFMLLYSELETNDYGLEMV